MVQVSAPLSPSEQSSQMQRLDSVYAHSRFHVFIFRTKLKIAIDIP